MMKESRIIDRSGCKLHYWLEGPKHAPVVVLTHGATLDHRMYDVQAESLSARFRVIRWDLPGHGRSRPVPASFSMQTAVQDLAAILDREDTGTVTLIGQSMGGDLCQAFVSRYPERVQRMVLIGCAPLSGPAGPVARLRSRWAIFKLRLVPMQRFRRRLAAGAAVNSQVQTYAANCLARMSRGDLIATWKAISSAAQIDAPDQLPCHTLMIVGERDDVGNGWVRQAALDWAKTEPSAELARIPAAGHITNMDAPDTVTQRILSFLNQAG